MFRVGMQDFPNVIRVLAAFLARPAVVRGVGGAFGNNRIARAIRMSGAQSSLLWRT